MQLVIRTDAGDMPLWAPAKTIEQLYGVNHNALYRMRQEGLVKSRKLPGGSRAGRVYRVKDIETYLEGKQKTETEGVING